MNEVQSLKDAANYIKSGDRIYIHAAAATPRALVQAMVDRADELSNIEIFHLHTEGDANYAKPEYADTFHVNSMFLAANCREATNSGRADFIPCFLSEVPIMLRRKRIPIDVALIQVSPPDKHGFCSLGVSVEATMAAIENADRVIAQVNPQMPRTHGDGMVHVSDFAAYCVHDEPMYEGQDPSIV